MWYFWFTIGYLTAINLVAFIVYGIDKRQAIKGRWRISEATLFILALVGGALGALLGMLLFRHKTRKLKFQLGIPLILIMEVIVIYLFLFI